MLKILGYALLQYVSWEWHDITRDTMCAYLGSGLCGLLTFLTIFPAVTGPCFLGWWGELLSFITHPVKDMQSQRANQAWCPVLKHWHTIDVVGYLRTFSFCPRQFISNSWRPVTSILNAEGNLLKVCNNWRDIKLNSTCWWLCSCQISSNCFTFSLLVKLIH